jgi:hypothetical protein
MRRERVRRNFQQAGEIAGCEAIRLLPDQRSKGIQTGRLRKGGKRQDGIFRFHNSRSMEIFRSSQLDFRTLEGDIFPIF